MGGYKRKARFGKRARENRDYPRPRGGHDTQKNRTLSMVYTFVRERLGSTNAEPTIHEEKIVRSDALVGSRLQALPTPMT